MDAPPAWLTLHNVPDRNTDMVLSAAEMATSELSRRGQPDPERVTVFAGSFTDAFHEGVRVGCDTFVEMAGEHGQATLVDVLGDAMAAPGFFASLGSPTVYQSSLPQLITDHLARRYQLSEADAFNIRTVLAELLTNALVHGNLELESPDYQSIEDVGRFQAEIERRLVHDRFIEKRVCFSCFPVGAPGARRLRMAITDDGLGFIPETEAQDMTTNMGASGRGLELVRAMSDEVDHCDAGRTVIVHFAIPFVDRDGVEHLPPAPLSTMSEGAATPQTDEKPPLVRSISVATPMVADPPIVDADQLLGSIGDSLILIADDEDLMRTIIQLHLEAEGYTNLIFAADGKEAWDLLRERRPVIAILDVEMPEMTGFEVTERLRADKELKDTPIIIASAHTETEFRNRALSLGASDVLSKPIDPALLSDRVRLHVQNRRLLESLSDYHQRLESELNAARTMLQSLLPSEHDLVALSEEYGMNLQAFYKPSSELGGDWWGVLPLTSSRFAIYTVDFTGHGVGACINVFRMHTLMMMGAENLEAMKPSEFLGEMNHQLHRLLPRGQFATMFYGIVDVEADVLSFAGAGAPGPLLLCRSSGENAVLPTAGLPLGVSLQATYEDHRIDGLRGKSLMLYSDALIETAGPDGTHLDLGTIAKEALRHLKPDITGHELTGLLAWFDAQTTQVPEDDLTLLLLSRLR